MFALFVSKDRENFSLLLDFSSVLLVILLSGAITNVLEYYVVTYRYLILSSSGIQLVCGVKHYVCQLCRSSDIT